MMQRSNVIFSHLQSGQAAAACGLAASPTNGIRQKNYSNRPGQPTKAVIFDMGGVLLPSPGKLFAGKSHLVDPVLLGNRVLTY